MMMLFLWGIYTLMCNFSELCKEYLHCRGCKTGIFMLYLTIQCKTSFVLQISNCNMSKKSILLGKT